MAFKLFHCRRPWLRKRKRAPSSSREEAKVEEDENQKNTIRPDGEVPCCVIMDILSTLPIKDVVRFRCVSQAWSSLILDPHFSQLHIQRAPPGYALLTPSDLPGATFKFSLLDIDRNKTYGYFPRVQHLSTECTLPGEHLNLETSCNGLLCVSGSDAVYVCNPVLGEYIVLPEMKNKGCDRWILGFGFTTTSCIKNYKVLQAIHDPSNPGKHELQMHIIGSMTWKKLGDPPFSLHKDLDAAGVFLNGSLHWFSKSYEKPYQFCSFDLESEQFQSFPGPKVELAIPTIDGEKNPLAFFRVSRGLLYFLHFKLNNIDLWVMKEYGAQDSWIKLNTISLNPQLRHYPSKLYRINLLDYGVREGDELAKHVLMLACSIVDHVWIVRGEDWKFESLLPHYKSSVIYHQEREVVREVDTYGRDEWFAFSANEVASLVSLRDIAAGEDGLKVLSFHQPRRAWRQRLWWLLGALVILFYISWHLTVKELQE